MMLTRPRQTLRPRRMLLGSAALTLLLGASTVAFIATRQAGQSPSLSPDGLASAIDVSQLGAAFARGELPVELLLMGAAVALAVGIAAPSLVAGLRRRRPPTAHSHAAPEEAAGILGSPALEWPIQDATVRLAPVATPIRSEPSLTVARPSSALLDAADAEALAAWEAASDIAALRTAVEAIRLSGTRSHPEPARSLDVARQLMPLASTTMSLPSPAPGTPARSAVNGTPPTWRPESPPAGPAIASAEAPHPANTQPAPSAIGTADALAAQPRRAAESEQPGPNLPLVAALGSVMVGIAFSAGSAVGATLGMGVGAAIGVAFAGGAGVAIGATVALLGGNRR